LGISNAASLSRNDNQNVNYQINFNEPIPSGLLTGIIVKIHDELISATNIFHPSLPQGDQIASQNITTSETSSTLSFTLSTNLSLLTTTKKYVYVRVFFIFQEIVLLSEAVDFDLLIARPEPVLYQGWLNTSTFGANNMNVHRDLLVSKNATISSTLTVADKGHFQNKLLVASSMEVLNQAVGNSNLAHNLIVQDGITIANGSTKFASLRLTDSFLSVYYTTGTGETYEYNLLAIQPAGPNLGN
jgi:hypothetical protein